MILLGGGDERDDRAQAIDAEAGGGFVGGHDERDGQHPGQAHAQQQPRAQVEPIPDHQMVVVPHTHHFVMFDDRDAFFKVVDKFLADHPAK